MPNIKSAIKRVSSNERKAEFNKHKKSELKTILKKTENVLATSADTATEAVRYAQAKLDHAAAKGRVSKNRASRKKSQYARKLNAMQA